ncbi:PD-(D/E)XK nuclease family protein [Nocardia cyriacigeorgica]|uniref:PD-(D/E)XK nuclease family protein n=1 Tax=Nocardia cyriacigeorgica TaxID=135487 RepID=UPI001E4E0E56|nr:PD-(D/E)XK nuclease family protein [Nocardia cyriacigeorgica]
MVRSDNAVRLVRRKVAAPGPRVWSAEVRALFATAADPGSLRPGTGVWQVLGGPGTGKTALLVDLAADRIAAGADPESVLLLTHSKNAAAVVRDAITARLSAPVEVAPEPASPPDDSGPGDSLFEPPPDPEAPWDEAGLFALDELDAVLDSGDGTRQDSPTGPETGGRPSTGAMRAPESMQAKSFDAGPAADAALPFEEESDSIDAAQAPEPRDAATDAAHYVGVPGATREPLVRTIHSYAFSVLRRHAVAHGNPPPRLLTGSEQDAVLREMLRGDLIDIAEGATHLWPQRLHPALGLAGFADQLRDLMLRATERGLGPEDLIRLGRERDKPEWVAAGRFAARYEQAMLLRWSVGVAAPEASAPALNAAELVGAALDALATDEKLLAAERERLRYLLVDDAQHLDPQAAMLVRVLSAGAAVTVVAGDPDQGVFAFRGADPRFLLDLDVPDRQRIVLRENHRSVPAVRLAVARVAARLPGSAPQRPRVDERANTAPESGADVRVRVLATPAKEAALIADHLRRAHLTEGVPWSQMAVVVRSVPLSLPPLRRALLAAGVPVRQPALDTPLARRRGAAWMLSSLRAILASEAATSADTTATPHRHEALFTPDDALDLLSGPLGAADQIALRRLRRGIRRTALGLERAAARHSDTRSPFDIENLSAPGDPGTEPDDFLPPPDPADSDLRVPAEALVPEPPDLLPPPDPIDAADITPEWTIEQASRLSADADWYGIDPDPYDREEQRYGHPTEGPDGDDDADANGTVDPREPISGTPAGPPEEPLLRDRRTSAPSEQSSAEVLRDLLLGVGDQRILAGLTEVESAPLRRALTALDRARKARRRGGGLEDVLWALWTGSRLERRWVAQSERGGAAGAQADRDLDAAVALFDAAAAYVDRLPRAGIEGFVEYLLHQEIPHDTSVRTSLVEAVELLSAHAAAGREWEVVAVAGVQEGIWPDPRPRGTLLHTEDLVDVAAGVLTEGERMSRAAPILAEERRLLLVACSRARRSLLVTAVESVTGDRDLVPSRFLAELLGHDDDREPGALPVDDPGRALVMGSLVAELRGVVCDPEADPQRRRRAARHLARLADAGVRGTAPDDWYGTAELSSERPLWDDDESAVALSPSTVELLRTCPLRWALERHGGTDGDNPHAVKGNLVHTLVQALAGKVPTSQVRAALQAVWQSVETDQGWHSRQERRRTEAMLETFLAWVDNTRGELTQVGIEVPVDCVLPPRSEDEPPVRIRGRVDRLERDAQGRFVIVDVKTGKNPVSVKAAEDHAQLATYQVAAAFGALDALYDESGSTRSDLGEASTEPEGTGDRDRPGDTDERRDGGEPGDVDGRGDTEDSGGPDEPGNLACGFAEEQAGAHDSTAPGAPHLDLGEPGGARLVYVAKPHTRDGATQRTQQPLDAESLHTWRGTIHEAAAATKGPSYLAMRNDGCRHCAVAGSCPVQDTGRQVTDE